MSFYRVSSTSERICFTLIRAGANCSPVGISRAYGNPMTDSDEPRSGNYAVSYYAPKHRWFLVAGCP